MAKSRILDIVTEAFLDGVTGAALFGKLRRPGAPTVLWVEDGSTPSDEEVAAVVNRLLEEVKALQRSDSLRRAMRSSRPC